MNVKEDLWNANLYDQKHHFVSTYGNDLIQILNIQLGDNILDVGCGTGTLTNDIAQKGANVVGIDQSANMISTASSKYPTIPFHVMDATTLSFDQEFDFVFSNATLHWIKEAEKVAQAMYQSLKTGGKLVIEFGGKGNVETITKELIQQIKAHGFHFESNDFPWYFPSISEYTTLLETVGFEVELAHLYDRPTPLDGENGLRNWLDMFSPSFFSKMDADAKDSIMRKTVLELREKLYRNGEWIADYRRLRIIAVK
jgi:trans-aconitate methyltransferase